MKHDSDILKRIKQYFMRRKSAADAHSFEREAERDQFLYEALEGFEDMLSSDIQQALDELDDRLDRQTNRSIFIYWKQAAAVAALIAVGTIAYNVIDFSSDNEPVNDAEESTAQEYEPRKTMPVFDLEEAPDVDYAVAEQDEIKATPLEENEGSKHVIDDKTSNSEVVNDLKKPAVNELAKEDAKNKKNLDSPARDRIKEEVASSDDAELLDVELEQKSTPKAAAAEPQQQYMQEISTTSKNRNASSAAPKSGMTAYKSYVKQNLKKTEGMPSGSVVVSFEFDKDGKPQKINIDKSLCTACDAEAIRVIQNGPEWEVSDRKERVQFTVDFK